MMTSAQIKKCVWRLVAAGGVLVVAIGQTTVAADTADEGAGGQPQQASSESDSLQYYQDLMQRAAQRAEKEAAAADEKGQVPHPLRKSRTPTSGTDSGPIRAAGPPADIIKNEAGQYKVVSEGEVPPESRSAVEPAKPAAAEPENRPFPTSDEINEMDREARRFTMSSFLSFLVIAAVVLMVVYVLPAVVGGRKSVASKDPPKDASAT